MRQRVEHWEVKVAHFARELIGQPFEWGKTDCVCVVLQCLDVMCNTDIASEVLGCYATPESAYKQQQRGDGLVDILERWGAEKIGCPCLARRGDVLIGKRDGFFAGHLVLGRHCLSSDPAAGVVLVELAEVTKVQGLTAWRY